jgi:hypothetical protein
MAMGLAELLVDVLAALVEGIVDWAGKDSEQDTGEADKSNRERDEINRS